MTKKRSVAVTVALVALLFVALYDLWLSLDAIRFIVARGSSLSDALFAPPTSIIRLSACGLICFGAAFSISGQRFGGWLILPGLLLYTLLVTALALASYGIAIWQFEALRLGIMLALLTFIAVFHAIRRKSSAAPH